MKSGQSISDIMDCFASFLGVVHSPSTPSGADSVIRNSIGIGSIINDYSSTTQPLKLTKDIYNAHETGSSIKN